MTKASKNHSEKRYITIWLLLIVMCCAVLWINLSNNEKSYNAGLLSALNINSSEHQAAIALGKGYQNKVLLLIGQKELNKAVTIADDIREQLKHKPWIDSIYSNPINSEHLQQLITYYGTSPFSYLTEQQKQMLLQSLENKQSSQLTEQYFALLNQWADPIVSQSLEQDQTLTLASFLKERLLSSTQTKSNWQFSQQEFMLKGDELNYIPLFITIAPEHLNISDSVIVYEDLQKIKATYNHQQNDEGSGKLLMTGMLFHSASASLQAQSEISSFGLLSLACVLIIIFLAFRSIVPIVACLLVIGSALILGVTALVFWFDSIHLLALVFAISILGIAVDYGFHVLVLKQHTKASAQTTRNKVKLPLTIALVSTIAGYSLFFSTPIQLLHQVVIFVSFGLIGAYLSALWLLPSVQLNHQGTLFAVSPKQHVIFLLLAAILFVFNINTLHFNDNVANLNTKSTQLVEEEQEVATLTGDNVYPHMVLVSGDSYDSLLFNTQQITEQLRSNGAVLKSIADWQIPQQNQQQNIDLLKENWKTGTYNTIQTYIDADTISLSLTQDRPLPPMPNDLRNTLGLDIKKIDNQYWTALLLNAPLSDRQSTIVIKNLNTQYINLPKALSEQLGEVRANVIHIALPALVIIFILLSVYFGIISAFMMLLVPTVAAGLALLGSQLVQGSLNIFNVLACLLIITLAIDYVVFFRTHGVTKFISHTIGLSALSSALTFGVMTYSSTPAVSSFGLTLLLGIFLAWLLSHLTPLYFNKIIEHGNN